MEFVGVWTCLTIAVTVRARGSAALHSVLGNWVCKVFYFCHSPWAFSPRGIGFCDLFRSLFRRGNKSHQIQCRRHGTMVARHAAAGGVPGQVAGLMRVPQGRHSFVTASSAPRPALSFSLSSLAPPLRRRGGSALLLHLSSRSEAKDLLFRRAAMMRLPHFRSSLALRDDRRQPISSGVGSDYFLICFSLLAFLSAVVRRKNPA